MNEQTVKTSKMKLRSAGLTVLIVVGVFVLGVLLMNFVVMPLVIHQRDSVIVPDVRRVSHQQAEKMLDRLSLEIRVDRSQNDTEVPEEQAHDMDAEQTS